MVADLAANLQRCKLHQQQLLVARTNLAQRLGELSNIHDKLHDSEAKLLGIDQKLPLLQAAMTPIRSQAAIASGLATRVDSALQRANAVLDIFKSIHDTERKLRVDDPKHDLRKYLALVCSMERYLQTLKEEYGPSLEWLDGVFRFVNQSQVLDKYSLVKLAEDLKHSRGLDPHMELMRLGGGGMMNTALRKLEDEFGRLLAVNCYSVDLTPHKHGSAPLPVATLMKQDIIIQLLVIADRLRVNNRLDECLHMYKVARGRMLKKCMASLKPEYLRYSSTEALRELRWESIHEFLAPWMEDFKVVVKVLMPVERELCNEVFPTLDPSERADVFAEIVQESKFVLFFKFAEAVACTQHRPEALLVGLLFVFKGLEDLKEDLREEFGGCPATLAEIVDVRRMLVHNMCRAFWELVKNVEMHQSDVPIDGGKDRNASFVVNYMGMLLRDFPGTMELVFKSQHSSKAAGAMVDANLSGAVCSMMDALEKNLEERASKGYADPILAHVFLMNNYRHILVRLKECNGLAVCLGEDFKVQWRKKVDHNMRSYLKKAWERVMVHLSREGLHLSAGSRGSSKDVLRARMKAFNAAFDETYKQQCRWVIVDPQLRDSVQLAITQLLVPAYHSFMQTYVPLLDEGGHPHKKVIKYSGDALQNMVRNMFEGKEPHFMSAEPNHSY